MLIVDNAGVQQIPEASWRIVQDPSGFTFRICRLPVFGIVFKAAIRWSSVAFILQRNSVLYSKFHLTLKYKTFE